MTQEQTWTELIHSSPLEATKAFFSLQKELAQETDPARRKIIEQMMVEAEYFARSKSSRMARPVETGTVRYFNHDMGYGFITRSNGKGDAFVHHSATDRYLDVGNQVRFRICESEKGPIAQGVRLLQ